MRTPTGSSRAGTARQAIVAVLAARHRVERACDFVEGRVNDHDGNASECRGVLGVGVFGYGLEVCL